MLKTQSKDRSFIADAGLKGTGFLFRFLNKLKMLGVFIFLPFAGVEAMSAFFCFFAFRTFPLPFRLRKAFGVPVGVGWILKASESDNPPVNWVMR